MPSYTYLNLRTRISEEINDATNADVSVGVVNKAIISAIEHHERQRKWFNETITRSVVTVSGAPAVASPTDLVYLERVDCATTGTVTGDSHGTGTIDGIADTSALSAGMFVTQSLIPASTMIRSVASTSFTMMDVYGATVTASTSTGLTIRYASKNYRTLRRVSYDEYAGREWASSSGEPVDYAYHQDRIWLWPTPNTVYSLRLSYIARLTTLSADGDNNGWTNYAEPVIRNRAKWDIFANYLRMPKLAELSKAQEVDALQALEVENEQRNMTGKLKARFL